MLVPSDLRHFEMVDVIRRGMRFDLLVGLVAAVHFELILR